MTTEKRNLPKRMRYYQGMIDLNLIERGVDFNKLKSCYIVFICTFDPFHQRMPLYVFENRCVGKLDLKLGDESTKIFVNGTAKDVPDELGQFIRFLSDGTVEPGITREISDAVEKVKSHREWERDYMTLYMLERENREIGRTEGLIEGEARTIVTMVERYMTNHNCSAQDACEVFGCAYKEYTDAKELLEKTERFE